MITSDNPGELLACPFCGGVAQFGKSGGSTTHVYCGACLSQSSFGEKDKVRDKWNLRTYQVQR